MVPKLSLQSSLDGSNTDGSFTMANSNSFLSPYEILPIAQEKIIFKEIFLFYREIVCCAYSLESPRRGDSNEYTPYNHCVENRKDFPKLSLFASWTGAMINLQWLELPMSRTNFPGPKDVRAIEVRLYLPPDRPQWLELTMSRTNFHGPKDVRIIEVRQECTY